MSNTDKEQQSEQQDAKQNELNLEFNEFEPITPKRPAVEAAPSFIDKLKGIFNKKAAKAETFQQAEVEQAVENTENNEFAAEPVTAHKASALANLSTRSRRLLISAAVLVIIIVLFLWLKPSSQPVDSLQSQDNNLPIEFQPIDPNAANANNEGVPTMQTEEQAMDNANANVTDAATANNDAAVTAETIAQNSTAPIPAVDNTPITTDENNAAATNQAQTPAVAPAPVAPAPKAEQKPALSQAQIDKIEKQAYEAEQARLIAKAKARAEQRAREEFRAKQQKQKELEQRKAQAILDGKNVPVVDAKPVARSSSKSTSSVTTAASGSQAKTLTIPAGTSLMQVFRDNKLNIADVNAMTKANGAGNALSSFKPGDKVAVKVNNDGRVSELQLPNGSKFIRQSNGTYIYQK